MTNDDSRQQKVTKNSNSSTRSRKKQRGGRISITCITICVVGIFVLYISFVLTKFGDYHKVSISNNGIQSGSKNGEWVSIRHGSLSQRNNVATTTKPQQDTIESLKTTQQSPQEQQKRVPTIQDFCGLCQWKGQSFNCNTRIDWLVKTKKHASIQAAQLVELLYCTNYHGCGSNTNSSNEVDAETGFIICEDLDDNIKKLKKNDNYKQGTNHVEKAPELEDILSGAVFQRTLLSYLTTKKDNGIVKLDGMIDRRKGDDILLSVLNAAKFGDRQYDITNATTTIEEDEDGDESGSNFADKHQSNNNNMREKGGGRPPILTAYCEPVNQTAWETKPLPLRDGTTATLFPIQYPHVTSCSALSSQWPINTPPVDIDPFLPWIHDVFPSSDGHDVIFVAQNRRRCYNGQRRVQLGERLPKGVISHQNYVHIDYTKNYFMRPQSALFQHVPVKRILFSQQQQRRQQQQDDRSTVDDNNNDILLEEPRYRLASHEDADSDGMETRFICRFKYYDATKTTMSIIGYTLSRYIVDYDYHTYRKGYKFSATEAGYDNHMIWQSQLLFKCPIPNAYHDKVSRGSTVINDYATLYVDVIPIRTPPRYTPPREFLQPRYEFSNEIENLFLPEIEWGEDHILPKINDSGRWENIPICMPSLMSAGLIPAGTEINKLATGILPENDADRTYVSITGELPPKIHKVIACTWASTTFHTRSNRAQVDDGKRRLQEWLEFNLVAGFDHVYVYDNSGAFTSKDSLSDIINLFPRDKVTRIDWPCKICSNRDGNEGERSSQYAAESSCRLRFGTHARWLGSFDSDEYLIPMGNYTSIGDVADGLDNLGVKIAAFKSAPAKPRFDLLDNPDKTKDESDGGTFTPTVTSNETFLHTYNCNWEAFPRIHDLTHRRKQMYRADYVKLHYVHYSTITVISQMSEKETRAIPHEDWRHKYTERHVHEFDEKYEATMLHTKTKVARNTIGWSSSCRSTKNAFTSDGGICNLGFPLPTTKDESSPPPLVRDDGWAYNCYMNEKVENYWWPKLAKAIQKRKGEITTIK